MIGISDTDLSALDAVWRALPKGHPWCGWAYIEADENEIWVFRERANWRRFTLKKDVRNWVLYDDSTRVIAQLETLQDIPAAVDAAPALPVD